MKKFTILTVFKEMRVKSWLKNLFVFFPIVFSLEMFEIDRLIKAVVLTFAFCLVSSAIYILNDLMDVESDRKHELKKNRPIASGLFPIPFAWVLLILLMAAGLGLSFWVNYVALILTGSYIVINLLYSKWLKFAAIIDCFCIAAGFVLRVMAGGTIVDEGVSGWMFLTVISLSLFMAFGKRRGELRIYSDGETRDVLGTYDMGFLNGSIFMCAGLTLVFYSLWSITQKTSLVYTVPFVMFIVIRYLLLVFKGRSDGDPTNLLLSDKILLITCALYALTMIGILYLPGILPCF